MATLRAHFGSPEAHHRLSFHPSCAVCRENRLVGNLPSASLVSRRAQAAIAAGTLLFTSIAPSTSAVASGRQSPGGTPAEQSFAEEAGAADLGAATDQLGDDGVASDTGEGTDPTVPVTSIPDEAASAPVPAAEPTIAEPVPTEPAAPEPEAVVPEAAASAPPATVEPVAQVTAPEATAPGEAAPGDEVVESAPAVERRAKPGQKRVERRIKNAKRIVVASPPQAPRPAPAPVVTPAPAPAAPAVAPAPRVVAVAASSTPAPTAKPGDESHVVQRGESLWSIAADVLADGASPAQIAREVNRLWELNKSGIGTGDRNLLMAGTRLELQ